MSATKGIYTKESRQTKRHIHTCMFCGQSGTNLSDCDSERLREALTQAAIPYEAILMDSESRRWIAPAVWGAMENAVAAARAALSNQKG